MKSRSTRQRSAGLANATWPTMGLLVACLGLDAGSARADGLRADKDGLRADLTMAGRFDEKPATNIDSQWIGSVTPQLGFSRHAEFAKYDVLAQRRFDSLGGDVSPRPALDLAQASFLGATSDNLSWETWANYYRTRDPLDQDPRFTPSPGITQSSRGFAQLKLWRAEGLYQAQNHDNTAPSLANAWSQSGDLSVFPLRTQRGAWMMTGRYQDWTVNNSRVLAAATGLTGYRRYVTPTFSSELQVGVVSLDHDRTGYETPQLAWSVGVDGFAGALGLPFESHLRVERDVVTRGRAELSRDLAGLKMSAGYSRSVDAEGGPFSTTSLRDYGFVAIEDSRPAVVVVSLEGSYGHSRAREGDPRPLDVVRASGGLSRALNPWLTARTGYSFLQEREPDGLVSRRNRAEVSLTASLH